MITIRPEAEGFKMTFSNPGSGMRGYSVHARSVAEVHEAITHYLGGSSQHTRKPREKTCPLCRKQ